MPSRQNAGAKISQVRNNAEDWKNRAMFDTVDKHSRTRNSENRQRGPDEKKLVCDAESKEYGSVKL